MQTTQRPHPLFHHATSYPHIWNTIADYIKDPYDFINAALASKALHCIFTSDHIWRYFNVHSLESGFLDRFSRDARNRKAAAGIVDKLSFEQQQEWILENTASYMLLQCIRDNCFPYFEQGTRLRWCYFRATQPRSIELPDKPEDALDVLEWFPATRLRLTHFMYPREVVVKILNHNNLHAEDFEDQFRAEIPRFRDDKEIMLLAMARRPLLASYASPEVLSTQEFAALAQQHAYLLNVPEKLKDDFDYLLTACDGYKDPTRYEEYYERCMNMNCAKHDLNTLHVYHVIENASLRIQNDAQLLGYFLDKAEPVSIESLLKVLNQKIAVQVWCNRVEKHDRRAC